MLYFLKGNFFSKIIIIFIFSFKIDSITLDPDPNWTKILDPDPNSMYLDPQHCSHQIVTCVLRPASEVCELSGTDRAATSASEKVVSTGFNSVFCRLLFTSPTPWTNTIYYIPNTYIQCCESGSAWIQNFCLGPDLELLIQIKQKKKSITIASNKPMR